jgi:hypothetical protein
VRVVIYARNTTGHVVCAIHPGQADRVDQAHAAVAAALAAGELEPIAAAVPLPGLRAALDAATARVEQLEGQLAEALVASAQKDAALAVAAEKIAALEADLASVTEPASKPPSKRVAREG